MSPPPRLRVSMLPMLMAAALALAWPLAGAADGHDAPASKAAAKGDPHAAPAVAGKADPHTAPASAAKADPHAAQAAPAAAAKPAATAAAPAADPMDSLREKLAEKLGAAKAPGAGSPYVVRVVAKADNGGHASPAIATTMPRSRADTAAMVAALRAEKGADLHAAHWAYGGAGGPETWGSLKPEFAKCATGERQSPIDIRGGVKVDLDRSEEHTSNSSHG